MTHPLDDGTELINPLDGTPYSEIQRYGFFEGLQQVINTKYQRDREQAYPKLGEQLDMLWHELSASGSLSTSGEWFTSINIVKQSYPKPE